MSDPHAALAEVGVEVPAGNTVKVMENTADTHHLVLPVSPAAAGELSSEELEKVAGGMRVQTVIDVNGYPRSGRDARTGLA